ncbi:MAG: hypothetical protein QG646_3996 [Euryarchaeota archaeon]|jgi:hypothetical protein|nr:hypothetical protein [Euryarchaeota archaeon]
MRIIKKADNKRTAKTGEGKNLMQSFIVEHYLKKDVDVYCGGPDVFRGTVEACADNVLTLNNDGKFTHLAIDKIIALWSQ